MKVIFLHIDSGILFIANYAFQTGVLRGFEARFRRIADFDK